MDPTAPHSQKPLNHILVKPAGPDCNMNCRYCFYRGKKDLFPLSEIHRMEDSILEAVIRGLLQQGPTQVSFSWQGGEPTLMGLAFFKRAVALQNQYGQGKVVSNGLQTNGLIIDRDWAAFLKQTPFLVGLSLDGPEPIHDHYRKLLGGQGSFRLVCEAAKRLLDAGVEVNALSVVNDYSVDFPEEIYGFFKSLGLSYMQFIPCLETDPDHHQQAAPFSVASHDYGIFLCKLFDLWLADFSNGRPTTSIRFFESLLFRYAGEPPPECTLLRECGTYLVVEHNGDVFSCDFFVTPGHRLGNIRENRLLDLLHSPKQNTFGQFKAALSMECPQCRWLWLCRGGCLKDRQRDPRDRGLNHFCWAFKTFFSYADARLKKLVADWRQEHSRPNSKADLIRGKVGRNAPCPCGSGRKYKKCCGFKNSQI
jgi:serine-type anaerobic sulfatase-maturating enzyme